MREEKLFRRFLSFYGQNDFLLSLPAMERFVDFAELFVSYMSIDLSGGNA